MQNLPQMDFFKGNFTIYYKNLWSKYGNFNFFPLEYGDFERFSSKINLLCKTNLFFLVSCMVKFHHKKTLNLE